MPKISVLTPTIRPAGLVATQTSLSKQTFQDFEWLVEVSIPERGHDMNQAYNRMLRRANGELIVSLQDYITIDPGGLQAFWEAYQEHPDTFFTAPVGKEHADGIQWDWRPFPEARMDWMKWEIDWGAAPLEALKKIGGFDEFLDGKDVWTYGNVNTALRAHLAGYKFMNLYDNKATAFDHDKVFPHPFRHMNDPLLHNARLDEFWHGLRLPPLM